MRNALSRWRKLRGQASLEAALVTILLILAIFTIYGEFAADGIEPVMGAGYDAIQSSKPFTGKGGGS